MTRQQPVLRTEWLVTGVDGPNVGVPVSPLVKGMITTLDDLLDAGFTLTLTRDYMGKALHAKHLVGRGIPTRLVLRKATDQDRRRRLRKRW